MITCGCRCMVCKSQQLESFSFIAQDGYEDMHHSCKSCGTHFNHLDGETYVTCERCSFPKSKHEASG